MEEKTNQTQSAVFNYTAPLYRQLPALRTSLIGLKTLQNCRPIGNA